MAIRSFLAFELPGDIKETLKQVSEALRKTTRDVRWVRAANIHLTVIFLGNVEERDIGTIGQEAKSACDGFGPFDIALQGVGFFPNRRRPRVLWLGLDGDLERLSSLRDALQRSLIPFGVTEEKRPFRPHLTLGRFKKVGNIPRPLEDRLGEYEGLKSPVHSLKELILFKSTLRPDGAVYTKLNAWPLSGAQ